MIGGSPLLRRHHRDRLHERHAATLIELTHRLSDLDRPMAGDRIEHGLQAIAPDRHRVADEVEFEIGLGVEAGNGEVVVAQGGDGAVAAAKMQAEGVDLAGDGEAGADGIRANRGGGGLGGHAGCVPGRPRARVPVGVLIVMPGRPRRRERWVQGAGTAEAVEGIVGPFSVHVLAPFHAFDLAGGRGRLA